MTIDGVHYATNEPKNPEFCKTKTITPTRRTVLDGLMNWEYPSSLPAILIGMLDAGQNDKTIFAKAGGLKE
jgi:hypothetical protein